MAEHGITGGEARSRAYRIAAFVVRRYIESGMLEVELAREDPAVVAKIKAELLEVRSEILENDFHGEPEEGSELADVDLVGECG